MTDIQVGMEPSKKRKMSNGNSESKKKKVKVLSAPPENIENHPKIARRLNGYFNLGRDLNEAWDKVEQIDGFYVKPCSSSDRLVKRFSCINSDRLHCKMSYRLEHCEESGWSLKGVSSEGHSCDHQLKSRKFTKEFRLRRANKGDVVNLEKHESLSRRILIRCQSNRLGATRDDSKVILQNLTGRILRFARADKHVAYLICDRKKADRCSWGCVIVWNDVEKIWMLSSLSNEQHSCPHPASQLISFLLDNGSKITFVPIRPSDKESFHCNFVESFFEDYSNYKIECFNDEGVLERQNIDQVRTLLERNCLSQFTNYIENSFDAQSFEKGGYFLKINGITVGGFLYLLHDDGTLYIAELYIGSEFKRRRIGSSFLCHSSDYFDFIGEPCRIRVKNLEILCRYENKGGMALYNKVARDLSSFCESPNLGKRYDYSSELYCGYSTCSSVSPLSSNNISATSLSSIPVFNLLLEERRDRGDTFDSTEEDYSNIFDLWNEDILETPRDFCSLP